jgi:DNA-binding CsgD family transcriptional regulator
MTPEITVADIVTQLRVTNRLLAAQLRSTMKQSELIALLATTGASNQDIATILGTTAATVSNALVRSRKAEGKK